MAFNKHLQLELDCYVETTWDSVFNAREGTRGPASSSIASIELTPEEALEEVRVRQELEAILIARSSALTGPESAAPTRGGRSDETVEWSSFGESSNGDAGATRGFIPDWLLNPNESLGDFSKYLVSRNVRNAVKEVVKVALRDLVDSSQYQVSIVSHSWGTVVAYDSLLDLDVELPGLRVPTLMTFGSPLWLIRRLLEDRSGRKPPQVGQWVNVHARGDLVGAWLTPAGFKVDHEYEVPGFTGVGAHSSYFVEGNDEVQLKIVKPIILGSV
ncbi:MAG: hypothetical protein WKH64_04575 [Chloroflexia bacterium]